MPPSGPAPPLRPASVRDKCGINRNCVFLFLSALPYVSCQVLPAGTLAGFPSRLFSARSEGSLNPTEEKKKAPTLEQKRWCNAQKKCFFKCVFGPRSHEENAHCGISYEVVTSGPATAVCADGDDGNIPSFSLFLANFEKICFASGGKKAAGRAASI